ncbi:tyrosine-type recombinase/integrase [Tetragenococcus halophilus]|uniref:Tyrosine-type recombinase/integrase n=1 Tax=Tetragenococcus halophilus TaxID=51669 RepID=A0AB37D644_TETHA|nr:tyrosine-type recombinase/integrase [Tetragenococcus halophilus]QGP76879.1 tyrosine-type recombinase/integrase [Tetragenococcus halophilus]
MATYTKYTKKSGQTAWKVSGYLGIDPNTGKQVNVEKRGFNSKKEAQLFLNRKLVEIDKNGFKKENTGDTFKDIYELWLESYKMTVKESTLMILQRDFRNHILPKFGNKPLRKITITEIQKFANEKSKTHTQFKTFIFNISRIFKFAIKQGIVDKNPVDRIFMPRKKEDFEKSKIKYFTQEQLNIFLTYAKEHENTKKFSFFYLMANTGTRQGELLGLQWKHVDFSSQTLKIRQTLAKGKNNRPYLEEPKNKNSKRDIPLNNETIAILKHWRKIQREEMLLYGFNTMDKEQLVFSNRKNSFIEMSSPNYWVKCICKRSGLPQLSPHALRHTFATILISQGKDFKTVSELLGHTNISMTLDVYAGVYKEQKTDAVNVISSILQ